MKFSVDVTGIERINAVLSTLQKAGSTPAWRDLWHDLAIYGQRVVQLRFQTGGKRGQGDWPNPYWLFTTIRKNVKKKRGGMRTIQDVKDTTANPLNDTGQLRQSWTSGQNLYSTNAYSEIGTHLPYAEDHQEGKTVPFRFDADKKQRFDYNVEMGEKGNWNKDYFIMLALWRRLDKRGSIKLQKREQVPSDFPTSGDRTRLIAIVHSWVERQIAIGGGK